MISFCFTTNNAVHAGLEDQSQDDVVQVLAEVLQPPDCDAAFQPCYDGNTLDSSAALAYNLPHFPRARNIWLAQDIHACRLPY